MTTTKLESLRLKKDLKSSAVERFTSKTLAEYLSLFSLPADAKQKETLKQQFVNRMNRNDCESVKMSFQSWEAIRKPSLNKEAN